MEVRQCHTVDGRTPVTEWLEGLRDPIARARIFTRLDRLAVALRGDWKSLGGGIHELRIDHGPGYRVYYAHEAATVILLLCGGDKRTQLRDIQVAHAYWKDYKARAR